MAALGKKKSSQKKASFAPRQGQSKPIWALVFLACSILYFVALLDFEPRQSRLIQAGGEASTNLVGALGAELAGYSILFLGILSWIVPLFLFWISYLLMFRQAHRVRGRLIIAMLVCLLSLTGLGSLMEQHILNTESGSSHPAESVRFQETPSEAFYESGMRTHFNGVGGTVGKWILSPVIIDNIGLAGIALTLLLGLFGSAAFMASDNFARSWEHFQEQWAKRRQARLEAREKARAAAQMEAAKAESVIPLKKKGSEPAEVVVKVSAPRPPSTRRPILSESGEESLTRPPKPLPPGQPIFEEPEPPVDPNVDAASSTEAAPKEDNSPALSLKQKKNGGTEGGLKMPLKPTRSGGVMIIEGEKTEKAQINRPEKRGNYVFPPLNLLTDPAIPEEHDKDPQDHQETIGNLVRVLDEFGVKVSPSEIHTGPVITRYEVTPAPGVRVEKILNLDKNIALGLKALAVRILAPVPGKGTVGIEVPNRISVPVCMKEIVESKAWVDSKAEIPIVLGKDVTGKPIVEDLTKMPHMLIAGSTGSGKTVCINAVIASLLYHAGPEDLRFIMVDPKVVEMQVFNDLPHMLLPVVTDPKKVPGALKYLLNEMERRYQIFAKVQVRNIAGFNKKLIKDKAEREKAEAMEAEMASQMSPEERAAASTIDVPRDLELEIPTRKMPYIVCIIDELADLMMVAPQDIETGVARLAQLARAAGIHLILATQRPSVNVITGVIKANLPTRISFKVASKIDSRTILDQGGAEALIGKGDMLFVPPGTSNLVRAQGAFVSDEEIHGIVAYLRERNGEPEYDENIQRQIESSGDEEGGGEDGEWDDELVPQAIDVLRSTKRASTSMLQRRLRIGYNRAARIMEILEDEGIVGPENGSSPREILRDLDSL